MAQQTPATPQDLDKQTELLRKQKEFLDAQKQVLEAQKALEELRKPPPAATLAEVTAAKTAKELADAQKALADARKAQSDSELAAFKSSLGEVPSSGLTGAVEAKEKTGELEAALLAMTAVREGADTIGKRIRALLADNTKIVAMSAGEVPAFQNMIAYDSEVAVVLSVLQTAVKAATPKTGPATEAPPILGAAGFLLDATSKLLSFFKTDFTVQGIALTLEDAVAVHTVAGNLAQKVDGKAFSVAVPAIFDPGALDEQAKFFIDDVNRMSVERANAETQVARLEALIADLKKAIDSATDPNIKKAFEDQLEVQTKLLTGLKAATALMDSWYTKLGAPDSKGTATLVHVVKEKAIAKSLKGAHLLVLKVQQAGGGFMIKKNLWTVFGGMPLYHMGGAAVSYTLIDGTSGFVKSAGVVPIHGGFVKAGDLRGTLAS